MAQLTWKRLVAAAGRRVSQHGVLRSAITSSTEALQRRGGTSILVLCYGNIYRSPLVAHLLRNDERLAGFSIDSAGFYPREGRPCDARYLELLGDRGHDLSSHRSTVVSREHLEAASLIVIMDRFQWQQLSQFGRPITDKTVWLGALSDSGSVEVEDPYGLPEAEVQQIIDQLEHGADLLAAALADRLP